MPTIERIDGIKIRMYSGNEHNPPHFHASYHGQEVQIDIKRMAVLKGELPPRQLRQVLEWAKPIQNELLALFKQYNPLLRDG
jgi:hypothetical protein